ncbi:MAG: chemotaxis protein CheD [Opitutaceae bacterium]|jgi:chemotaxis protein CheD
MAGSPTIGSIFAQRIVVGVAEFAVGNQPQSTISTYALGSCIGVVAYDPVARVGGLLHLMLPDSTISPEKAASQPAMFADTGIPILFNGLAGMRCQRSRIQLFLAGGASVLSGPDSFKIGERNIIAVRRMLAVYGCRIVGAEVGGILNRTLHLTVGTGQLSIKLPDQMIAVSLA